jgi:solute carrier family 35, member E3
MPAARDRFFFNYSLNFLSAILLIYASKWLFRHCPISSFTLTICNSLASALFATIALRFLPKPISNGSPAVNYRQKSYLVKYLLVGGSCAAFLTFSNLSLQLNTIGTYQLIKLQVPPVLMLLEWIQLRCGWNALVITEEKFFRTYSPSMFVAFAIIMLGSLVSICSDPSFHLFGVAYACISVLCNAFYQNLVQTDEGTSTYERIRFLQIQAFLSVGLLIPFCLLADPTFVFNRYVFSRLSVLSVVLICGFLAFIVNSSVIWCIRDDAAIGYNMVGHLKTLPIIFLGSALLGERLSSIQLLSVLGASVGGSIYVYLTYRRKESQRYEQELPPMNISL